MFQKVSTKLLQKIWKTVSRFGLLYDSQSSWASTADKKLLLFRWVPWYAFMNWSKCLPCLFFFSRLSLPKNLFFAKQFFEVMNNSTQILQKSCQTHSSVFVIRFILANICRILHDSFLEEHYLNLTKSFPEYSRNKKNTIRSQKVFLDSSQTLLLVFLFFLIFDDPRLPHSIFYANFLDSKTLFWISAQRQSFRSFIFVIVNRIVGCGATSAEVFDHKNINRKLNIHIFFC